MLFYDIARMRIKIIFVHVIRVPSEITCIKSRQSVISKPGSDNISIEEELTTLYYLNLLGYFLQRSHSDLQ
jgi:hypothetical protein